MSDAEPMERNERNEPSGVGEPGAPEPEAAEYIPRSAAGRSSSATTSSKDEFASADEQGHESPFSSGASNPGTPGCIGQRFSPGGKFDRSRSLQERTELVGLGFSRLGVPSTASPTPEKGQGHTPLSSQDNPGPRGDLFVDRDGDEGDDENESVESPRMNPLAMRNLDSGEALPLFKVYAIYDSVSGAEWVVDGEQKPGGDIAAVWKEKRVKDASTGSIISLAELEQILISRVLDQLGTHKVKDLDSGEEIDLFASVSKTSIADSVCKELRVRDTETGKLISLLELRQALVPAESQKQKKKRRLKLKSKNLKKFQAKLTTGLQAGAGLARQGMAGIQAGLEHVQEWEASRRAERDHPEEGEGTLDEAGKSHTLLPRPGHNVKVQVNRKQYKELTELQMLQELQVHEGAIWAMNFSPDGRYLATGGEDQMLRVWEVITSFPRIDICGDQPTASLGNQAAPEETKPTTVLSAGEAAVDSIDPAADSPPLPARSDTQEKPGDPLSAAARVASLGHLREVVRTKPYRQFEGHTAGILDVAWSASGFLLSSSMDKTARLWHISVDGECLKEFRHTDFVTVVRFHPLDDKLFISGSLDGKVRMWNTPRARVLDFADCHEMVTAATFSPDGTKVAAGTKVGTCRFYSCDRHNLSYAAQLDVCTSGKGCKITGLQYMPGQPHKILITSNDSRLRLFDTTELQQTCKYKGHANRSAQIRASFSRDGKYIVCGSDNGQVYMWTSVNPLIPALNPSYTGFRKDKNASYESFQTYEEMVTVAIFAPETARLRHEPIMPERQAANDSTASRSSYSCFAPRTDAVQDEPEPSRLDRSPEGVLHVPHGPPPNGETSVQRVPGPNDGYILPEVFVVAGYTGQIKFFQNHGTPRWV